MRPAFVGGMLMGRRFEKAVAQLQKSIELNSSYLNAHNSLIWAVVVLGRDDEAAATFEEYLRLIEQPAEDLRHFRTSFAESGFCDAIRNWLVSIEARIEIPGLSTTKRSMFQAWCGDRNQAFELLEKAFEQKSPEVNFIGAMPVYDKLHDDPRFDALLERVGLPKIEMPDPSSRP